MNELLNELLTLIDQNLIRIQPFTLEDTERASIQARIDDWARRVRARKATARLDRTLLHRLWTKAVGTLGYDKEQWEALETYLLEREHGTLDPKHCYLCDRPKLDCACTIEESESPA